MLETSKDLLFLIISICIIAFTFFFCWALYYITMMLKRAHSTIKEVSDLIASIKEKIDRLENLFKTIEEKLKHSTSYLPLVMKGVTELIDFIKRKKEKGAQKKNTKK